MEVVYDGLWLLGLDLNKRIGQYKLISSGRVLLSLVRQNNQSIWLPFPSDENLLVPFYNSKVIVIRKSIDQLGRYCDTFITGNKINAGCITNVTVKLFTVADEIRRLKCLHTFRLLAVGS